MSPVVRPPWREPMLWLVLGLPLAAVIASVALVVTAVRGGSDDSVRDEVTRAAQVQLTELGPDARAQALHLSAVLRATEAGIDVLPATGDFDRTAALDLVLAHPTEAARDRHVRLRPTELGWHAAIVPASGHDWILELTPGDGGWRLRGRLAGGRQAAHLAPALRSRAADPGG